MFTVRQGHDKFGLVLHFDALIEPCGKFFQDVASVHSLDSPNPLIRIQRPLGINGTLRIIEFVMLKEYLTIDRFE